jgi:hypothetical protein
MPHLNSMLSCHLQIPSVCNSHNTNLNCVETVQFVKGKFNPRTLHVDPEGEYRQNPTLSLTSVIDGVGW